MSIDSNYSVFIKIHVVFICIMHIQVKSYRQIWLSIPAQCLNEIICFSSFFTEQNILINIVISIMKLNVFNHFKN